MPLLHIHTEAESSCCGGSCLIHDMLLFSNFVRYPYDIVKTIQSVAQKYPNDYARHVVSVDTLSSEVLYPSAGEISSSSDSSTPSTSSSSSSSTVPTSDGSPIVRFEKLICVRQSAPKWVSKVRSSLFALEVKGMISSACLLLTHALLCPFFHS